MDGEALRDWRKAQRRRLIDARLAMDEATLAHWRERIDGHLSDAFPDLARGVVAFCWPVLAEYDARFLMRVLRERGAVTALPVVVAPRTPLIFREWEPGVLLEEGPMKIPHPAGSREVVPDTVLLPMNGWDAQGYRLGYGGGYFDRTLASLARRPRVIGVAYEMAKLATIYPQGWDIPVDAVVTECGVHPPERPAAGGHAGA